MNDIRFVLIGLTALLFCGVVSFICFRAAISYMADDFIQNQLNYRGHLIIKQSTIKDGGNGVFTTKDIKANEIVEICPLLVEDKTKFKESIFSDYVFNGSKIDGKDTTCVFPLGYGTLYNHSDDNNCSHNMNYNTNTMIIKSNIFISANSELFVTYGDKWWETRAHKEKK